MKLLLRFFAFVLLLSILTPQDANAQRTTTPRSAPAAATTTAAPAATSGGGAGQTLDSLRLLSFNQINSWDAKGQTPLHIAASQGKTDNIEYLLSRSADVSLKNGDGLTPFDLAVAGKHFPAAAILLRGDKDYAQKLEKLEDSDNPDDVSAAATLLQGGVSYTNGVNEHFERAVKMRNLSVRTTEGQTPLHIAVIQGKIGMVKFLLSQGAPTDLQDGMGSTPLHEAARNGNAAIAAALLNARADPNIRDISGKTALLQNMPQKNQFQFYKELLMYDLLGEIARPNAGNQNLDPLSSDERAYTASLKKMPANPARKAANPLLIDNFGNTALHVAVQNGADARVLNELITLGGDINARNNAGQTPISLAVDYRSIRLISYLIEKGADIHSEDVNGITPLGKVCQFYNDLLPLLVTAKNSNARNAYGNGPLHVSLTYATSGALETMSDLPYVMLAADQARYLVSVGCDPTAKNRDGNTPLHIAALRNLGEAGTFLIANAGVSIYSTNSQGVTPLQIALTQPDNSRDWFFSSRTMGTKDANGNTMLHYAAELGSDRILPILLQRGADVTARNTNGETALFSAVKANRPAMVDLLIQAGVPKETRDAFGNSPLHAGVTWSAAACVEKLIAMGADVNAKNGAGKTPLSDAVRNSNITLAEILLDHGASINAADAAGRTVLMDAVQGGDVACLRMLLNRGADPLAQEMNGNTAYHQAAKIGDIDMINLLRNAGANPLVRDANGITPFSLVVNQKVNVILAVLGPSAYLADTNGNTPIHLAAMSGATPATLTTLLDLKYPVNRRNSSGTTALSLAVQSGNREIVHALLEAGADPFIADNSGLTPITLAAQIAGYKPEALNLLTDILAYCDDKTDPSGNTPLHLIANITDLPVDIVRRVVSLYGNRQALNTLGESAYDIAKRWQKDKAIAELYH